MRAASARVGRPRAAADIAGLIANAADATTATTATAAIAAIAAATRVAEVAIDWSELPALTHTRQQRADLTEPGQLALA